MISDFPWTVFDEHPKSITSLLLINSEATRNSKANKDQNITLSLVKLILENVTFIHRLYFLRVNPLINRLCIPLPKHWVARSSPQDRPPVTCRQTEAWKSSGLGGSLLGEKEKEMGFTDSLINHRSSSLSESTGDPELRPLYFPPGRQKPPASVRE